MVERASSSLPVLGVAVFHHFGGAGDFNPFSRIVSAASFGENISFLVSIQGLEARLQRTSCLSLSTAFRLSLEAPLRSSLVILKTPDSLPPATLKISPIQA
jgi:hypothetical protein